MIQFDEHIFQNGVGEKNNYKKRDFLLFGLVKNLRSPKGILHFIADISGWWNLYTWESETWQLKDDRSGPTVRWLSLKVGGDISF